MFYMIPILGQRVDLWSNSLVTTIIWSGKVRMNHQNDERNLPVSRFRTQKYDNVCEIQNIDFVFFANSGQNVKWSKWIAYLPYQFAPLLG